MILLLWYDFLGVLFSFLAHLGLLLGLPVPSKKIALALNIGIGVAIGTRLLVTNELRQGKDWFFDKSLKGLCPYWLKWTTGIVAAYGVINCIYYFIKTISLLSITMTDASTPSRMLFISVFSLIMACYALEFTVLYLYKILKNEELKKIKGE
jgi:hypothetical protein